MNNSIPIIPIAAGFVFVTIIAHFPVSWLVEQLWKSVSSEGKKRKDLGPAYWLPRIIGTVERTLYLSSFIAGSPEFVGIWLALKTAGQWSAWKEGIKGKDDVEIISGHSVFSIWLIGNGASLAYALVGFHITENLKECPGSSILLVIALLVATLVLWIWAKWYENKETKTEG